MKEIENPELKSLLSAAKPTTLASLIADFYDSEQTETDLKVAALCFEILVNTVGKDEAVKMAFKSALG